MSTRAPTDSLPPPSTGERRSLLPPPPPKFLERQLGKATAPVEGKAILQQIEALGVASVGIVTVTSVFIGMVMAVQFAFGLRKFGGMEYTGRVVALSFARELAPTLTAIIVGGRIGAGMAAEVG